MKIKLFAASVILVFLVAPSFAGMFNVAARAGLYTANQAGASTSIMYGLAGDAHLTDNLTVRGAVDTTTYSVNGVQTTYTPVSLDLIYSQNIIGILTPYLGAGGTYSTTTVGGVSRQTSGAELLAGAKFSFLTLNAGAEIRYIIPDLNHTNIGSSVVTTYMSGSFAQSFSF